MSGRWTLRLVACAVGAAVVLTGCSAQQEASRTLPEVSSPAPSEEALPPLGPAAYPVPAQARAKSPAGALSFAKYYMGLGIEIGLGRAPAESMLDFSTPDCRLCRRVAQTFADDQAAGYIRQESTFTFEEYGPPLLVGDRADIGFVFTQSADRVVDASGREISERAGQASGDLQSGMQLTWRDDLQCWLVNSLTIG